MTDILDKDAPVLRQQAAAVPLEDISSPKIKAILARMKKALHAEDDGVGIAAPQIGESLRIFLVSGRVFDFLAGESEEIPAEQSRPDAVFINPEIIKISKDRKYVEEGCLSVRWLYGKIRRASKATIRAYDENGVAFERGASGILAQVFQHEVDHLNGILFIDSAKEIENLPPERQPRKRSSKKIETDHAAA